MKLKGLIGLLTRLITSEKRWTEMIVQPGEMITFPPLRKVFFGLEITSSKQAFLNRQNPNFYNLCKTLIGTENLWASLDRYGIMRPTRGVATGKFTNPVVLRGVAVDPALPTRDYPEWKTVSQWLHWDLNPWVWSSSKEGIDYEWDEDFIQENNGSRNTGEPKIQGLINFVDNRKGDGGFSCVSGFNQFIAEYASQTKDSKFAKDHSKDYSFVSVHKEDNLQNQVQEVSMRAGSALIWSSELPHCNYPNNSDHFRIVQYIKMFSSKEGQRGSDKRRTAVAHLTKAYGPTSDLGLKILGLKDWNK